MKLAVLIPCYNVEKYVTKCLDSVLAAGEKAASSSLSVFCCNDGSTDGTLKRLEEYAAEHPEVHYTSQPNAGVSATRNRLLDELPEEYDAVAFVDADDTVEPEYFARLAEAMERTDSEVAEYAFDLVEKETLVTDTTVLWLKRTNPGVRSAIVGKLIRRSAVDKVRLRPELKYEEDLMFSYELNAVICRKVILPGLPYNYQQNPNSATQNLNWRRYVESACRRVELFTSEFLGQSAVPERLVGEFESELIDDAFRMCIRKNLKKNPDARLRHELFIFAAGFFDRLAKSNPPLNYSKGGLQSRLFIALCRRRSYTLSRLFIALT